MVAENEGVVAANLKPEEDDSAAGVFVRSELFAKAFGEGMGLVELTANYLDGAGREASRHLSRSAALAYASASMRLTTLLMQIASWLLVLRAVREGEMTLVEARDEKYRLPERNLPLGDMRELGLPEELMTLAEQSSQLYARIARIDAEIFGDARAPARVRDAAAQQRALFDAFGQKL